MDIKQLYRFALGVMSDVKNKSIDAGVDTLIDIANNHKLSEPDIGIVVKEVVRKMQMSGDKELRKDSLNFFDKAQKIKERLNYDYSSIKEAKELTEAFEAGEYPYEELQKKIPFEDKKVIYRIISIINSSDDKNVTVQMVSKAADEAMSDGTGNGDGLTGISKRSGISKADIVDYIKYIVVGKTGDNVETVKPDGGKTSKSEDKLPSKKSVTKNAEGTDVYNFKESELEEEIEYEVGDDVYTRLGDGKIVKVLGNGEFAVKIGPEGTEAYNLQNKPYKFKLSDLQGKIDEKSNKLRGKLGKRSFSINLGEEEVPSRIKLSGLRNKVFPNIKGYEVRSKKGKVYASFGPDEEDEANEYVDKKHERFPELDIGVYEIAD